MPAGEDSLRVKRARVFRRTDHRPWQHGLSEVATSWRASQTNRVSATPPARWHFHPVLRLDDAVAEAAVVGAGGNGIAPPGWRIVGGVGHPSGPNSSALAEAVEGFVGDALQWRHESDEAPPMSL